MIKRFSIFIVCMLFAGLIAWLGGYNFDERSFVVAYWTGLAIIGSGFAAWFFEE